MKKRVLIIGAGERVRSGILPALLCLRGTHEIAALYARSAREITVLGSTFTTITSLSNVDFKTIDLIVISVPPEEMPQILRTLSVPAAAHCTLLIDTPILTPRNLAAARLFKKFKRVLATEESALLPPFMCAKELIASGAIGTLKHIYLFHSGYRYHALASLKMLAGNTVRSIAQYHYPFGVSQKEIAFADNSRATIYEPFRPPGTFLITGAKGYIADYPHEADAPVHHIEYATQSGLYAGLILDGKAVPNTAHDGLYTSTINSDVFSQASEKVKNAPFTNSMKIRALIDLLAAATEETPRYAYPASEALRDSLQCTMAEKIGFSFFI